MTVPGDEEEKYFKAIEAEQRAQLREKLAANAQALEEQRRIAASAGTDDLDVAARIRALGFDGDSARVFDLLPLVHVAWADGTIQRAERATLLRVLESRGIEPNSEAFRLIESLLEERPSDAFLNESLSVLRTVTGGLGERATDIVDLCIDIAAASGGFLGLGQRIDTDEKELIGEIVERLGGTAAEQFKRGVTDSDAE